MAVFTLKRGDTRPILEVALKNPDGTAHDLTGSTAWKLHIRLTSALVLTRDLVKEGLDTAGVLRYTWLSTDWGTSALPLTIPAYQTREYQMEYEVVGGTSRMTFPNSGHDTLKVVSDLSGP